MSIHRALVIFNFAAVVLTTAGCLPLPHQQVRGQLSTDGRDFGEHATAQPACEEASQDGVVLSMTVANNYRSRQAATIRVPSDAKAKGVDVHMPWSHVAIPPQMCSELDVKVARNAAHPAGVDAVVPEGWAGRVRVHCEVPETHDVLDADVSFDGCR